MSSCSHDAIIRIRNDPPDELTGGAITSMTLRDIVNAFLINELPADRRLKSLDIKIRFAIHSRQWVTFSVVAEMLGLDDETVRRSLKRLVRTGWAECLDDSQLHKIGVDAGRGTSGQRKTVIAPWLPRDIEARVADHLSLVRWGSRPIGEWLMRCWLDLIVASRKYIDNSRPTWLRLPSASAPLELDRDYPEERVGLEYQGSHHFIKGGKYAQSQSDVNEQYERDCAKIGVCQRNNYTLIEVTRQDLSMSTMMEKVKGRLPLAYFREDGEIRLKLTEISEHYKSLAPRDDSD